MAFDWYLDPTTGDLPRLWRGVARSDLILQRIRVRLGTHLGDVWENKNAGLPFIRWASSKVPDLDEVAAFVRREVEAIPGVLRTENVTSVVEGDAIRTTLRVVSPTDDGFRVRIDLLPRSAASSSGGAVTGSDPSPVPASPIVIVALIDPFLGL